MFDTSNDCFSVDVDRMELTKYVLDTLCEEADKWHYFPADQRSRRNKIFNSIYNKIVYQLDANRESINTKIMTRRELNSTAGFKVKMIPMK
jgi:hypothetical protein